MGYLSQVRTLFPCRSALTFFLFIFSLAAHGTDSKKQTIDSRKYRPSDLDGYNKLEKERDSHAAFLAATLDQTPGMRVNVFETNGNIVGFSVEEETRRERRLLGMNLGMTDDVFKIAIGEALVRTNSNQALTIMGNGLWAQKVEAHGTKRSPILWSFPIDPANEIISFRFPDEDDNYKGFAMWRRGRHEDKTNPDPLKMNLGSENDLGNVFLNQERGAITLKNIRLEDSSVILPIEKLIMRDLLYRSRSEDIKVEVAPFHNLSLHNFFKMRATCGADLENMTTQR